MSAFSDPEPSVVVRLQRRLKLAEEAFRRINERQRLVIVDLRAKVEK